MYTLYEVIILTGIEGTIRRINGAIRDFCGDNFFVLKFYTDAEFTRDK